VSGYLGDSEHVQSAKSNVAGRSAAVSVSGDLNETSVNSMDKTQAYIGAGSQVTAGRDVHVSAVDATKIDILSGGAAVGVGASVGGGIGIGFKKSTTEAFIGSGAIVNAEGDVAVNADTEDVDADGSRVKGIGGAAGLVGIGAAVAYLDSDNSTSASLKDGVQIQSANAVTVGAHEDINLQANAVGAAVGFGAVGGSLARAKATGSVSATTGSNLEVGNNGTNVGSFSVDAISTDTVNAKSIAGAAGIYSGSGAVAIAANDSVVTAGTGSDSIVKADGATTVHAKATPQADALTDALALSYVGSVGASVAHAMVSPTVTALLGTNNNITAGSLNVTAEKTLASATPSAAADAVGVSGGLLLGVSATSSTAEDESAVSASVGDGSTLILTGAAFVSASSDSHQKAEAKGLNFGFLALGANVADASSNSTTSASLGNNLAVSGTDLIVRATGTDENYADSIAGSGGVISGQAAIARTNTTSTTSATTGSGTDARGIEVNSLTVAATHTSEFDSRVNSLNAAIVGASGAFSENYSEGTVQTKVGDGAYVKADSIKLSATNKVAKSSPGASWNLKSGSGGAIDAPAAISETDIKNMTNVIVGDAASLIQNKLDIPGAFDLNATNDVQAYDKVKLDSGGLVSLASAESYIRANQVDASVNIGTDATLMAVEDLDLQAYATGVVYTQSSVDAYGLAGAPSGKAVSHYYADNSISVDQGAYLFAKNDVNLKAGSANKISVKAQSDLWNKTAFPIPVSPKADAIAKGDAAITIGTLADVAAARDVNFFSERGELSANIAGVGKDIYRELAAAALSGISNLFGGDDISFDLPVKGEKSTGGTTEVRVEGTARAGVENRKFVRVNPDGTFNFDGTTLQEQLGDFGLTPISIAGNILARIEKLKQLKSDYAGDPVSVAAYQSEIDFLQFKLVELGLDDPNNPGFAGTSGISPIAAIDGQLSVFSGKVTALEGEVATLESEQSTLTTNLALKDGEIQSANTRLGEIPAEKLAKQVTIDALDPGVPAEAAQITILQGELANLTTEENTLTNTTIPTLQGEYVAIDNNLSIVNVDLASTNSELTSVNSYVVNLNTQRDELDDDPSNFIAPAGPTALQLTIPDIVAKVGNVNIKADSLMGVGSLEAEGHAQIEIANDSRMFLEFNELTIPADNGGRVILNNVDISAATSDESRALIEGLNRVKGQAQFSNVITNANSGNKPEILVTSSYDPLGPKPTFDSNGDPLNRNSPEFLYYNGPAPDITFTGDVSNLRGAVKVASNAGSIIVDSGVNIHAGTIDISTRNGDIIQSYVDDFREVGGDPGALFNDSTLAPKGIIANGSIFMAARYLNINGTVQSGMPDWGVRVPATVQLDDGSGGSWTMGQAIADYDAKEMAGTLNPGDEFYQVTNATTVFSQPLADAEWNQIDVFYNALTGQLEVSGAAVKGGYVNLYGQIINTAWTTRSGWNTPTPGGAAVPVQEYRGNPGKIRALDGYGRIKVENDSSLDLVLNVLDTGRDKAGVISITNIKSIDANNVPSLERTEYTLLGDQIYVKKGDLALQSDGTMSYSSFAEDWIAGRTTEYNPQDGLRYSWTTGISDETVNYYRYWSRRFFDLPALTVDSSMDQYKISGPIVLSAKDLDNGAYLTDGNAGSNGQNNLDSFNFKYDEGITTSKVRTETDSWSQCDWWLCVTSQYFMEFNVKTGGKKVYTQSLAADYPIAIEFIGQDRGNVDIDSVGNVVTKGNITNRAGDTSINSGGAITQATQDVMTSADNLTLTANTGIGDATNDMLINIHDGGVLNAVTTTGDVRITETSGDMIVANVTTNDGYISLTTEGALLMNDASSRVKGSYLNLIAENGTIGTGSQAFNVEVGTPERAFDLPNYGLEALSRDNINIVQQGGGDLYLVAVKSQQGDVRIDAGAGQIIDNNSAQYADVRAIEELEALWEEMRLQGQNALDKVDDTITAYENSKTQNYRSYWRMRLNDNGTADTADDSYDPYNPTYNYRMTDAQSTALTEQYKAQALQNATLTSQDQRDNFVQGKLADFVQSKTDEYFFLQGEVGGLNDGVYAALYSYEATAEEKASFANKVQWSDEQLRLGMTPGMLKEVTDTVISIEEPNVKGNNVTLISGDNIGSTGATPVRIDITDDLTADTDEAKAARLALMTAEREDIAAVYAANGIDIVGFDITQRDTVDISMDGVNGGLDATAGGYAYIGSEGSVNLVNLAAQGEVRLKVAENITGVANPTGAHITGENLILEASNGGIGVAGSPLQLDLSSAASAPTLTMRADGDIFILEAANDINVDSIFSRGTVHLETPESIFDAIGDSETNIRSASINLVSGGAIGSYDNYLEVGLNPDGYFFGSALTGVYVASLDQPMNIGVVDTAAGDISLFAASNLGLGSVSTGGGGTMTLVSSGGSIENNLDPGALNIDAAGSTLILQTQTGMGSVAPIETKVDTLEVTLGGEGEANIHEADDLNLGTSQALKGSITLVSEADITSTITGPQVGVIKNLSLEARGGSINVEEAKVSNLMAVKADNIRLGNIINPDGTGPQHFTVSGNHIADMVRIGATSQAPIIFDSVFADYFYLNARVDNLVMNDTLIGSYAEIRNNKHKVVVDNKNKVLHPADVQLYTGSSPFYLEMFAEDLIKTDARVLNYDPSFIVNGYSSENSMLRSVYKQLQLVEDAGDFLGDEQRYRLDASTAVSPSAAFILHGDGLGISEEEELVDIDDLIIVTE